MRDERYCACGEAGADDIHFGGRRGGGGERETEANVVTLCDDKLPWTMDNRGRPKTTWRRTVEAEMKKMNHSWGTIQRLASDREGWKSFVAARYAGWSEG